MIKRIVTFFQLSILLLIFLLGSCEPSFEISAWDVIDSNSILVFESKFVPLLPDKIYKPFFSNKASLYLLAVQKSSKEDFDIVYSYLLPKESYDSILNHKVLSEYHKLINRKFNGIEIHEVKNGHNEIQLAFTYINGVLVLSSSSVLIENATRVFQNREKKNFKINNSALFLFPSLKSDQGDIYLNSSHISEVFPGESSLIEAIPLIKELKTQAVYDVKSSNGYLSLNGFSVGDNSSIAVFQKQKPVAFKIARYIPNYSTSLVHFGASDFHAIRNEIDSTFLKTFDIGNEMAFISGGNASKNLAAFIEYRSGSLDSFDFVTSYSEIYSNYQIRSVDGNKLKDGFGKMFPTIQFNFCTVKDNHLLLAQTVEEIKSIIDAIEIDDTWGKTLDYQKFSEKGLQESNVTLIVKNPTVFAGTSAILRDYPTLFETLGLSNIRWYSVQMSALDNHFYSNINFGLGSMDIKSPARKRDVKSASIELPVVVKFAAIVKNHNTEKNEILIQDSDFWIYLLSLKEGIIWKRKIESQIEGPLTQVDFLKNGKLQYFFSSDNKLFLIDRLGRDVSGFPKSLSSNIKYSSVVDYDKTKNYRFLISLLDNNTYLLDKEGKNLSEWGPKRLDSEVASTPEHIKIGGKDFFIVFLIDGSVQVFNRKGERAHIFYTQNKETFSGDYYLESGMLSSKSFLYYITIDGTLIKQNLDGEILSTSNLLRGRNSKFILKRIKNRDGFYISRIDTDKIVVFDKQEKIVFEMQNSGSSHVEFQCLERESKKMIFSFFDIEQKLVQIVDESGNSLTRTPIESDDEPLFVFGKSNGESGVYSFSQKSIIFNALQ